MNIRYRLLAALGMFCLASAYAEAYSQDVGKIKTLYISTSGQIAVQLDSGFPNAQSGGQCATASATSFASASAADPAFKAALLAAKAAQQSLVVTTQGCEGSGFKIIDIYVN